MRSELVFRANTRVLNRYQLAKLVSKVTRKLHKPNTRIEDTMNDAFERLSHGHLITEVPFENSLRPFSYTVQAEADPVPAYLKSAVA